MIRKLKPFEYLVPNTVPEAVAILQEHRRNAQIFAGGTDLLIGMKQSSQSPKYLLDIKRIDELKAFNYEESTGLRLGAATTIRDIETSQLVREKYPHLAQGAKAIACVQIRHRATVGGNICNASPCADTVPNLIVSEATLVLEGPKGRRQLPMEDFFLGPGFSALDNELLVEIRVPSPGPHSYSRFMDISRRQALDLSLVSVAVRLDLSSPGAQVENVRLALGSVGPTVFRAKMTELLLEGSALTPALIEEAGQCAAGEARPIDDVRASAWYRREMVATLCKRALKQIAEEANARRGQ